MAEFKHIPVMLVECIEGLDIKPDGIYIDGTLGGGGHSEQIAKKLTTGKLIAIDKDEDALMFAAERLKEYKDKIIFIHDDFKNIKHILDNEKLESIDGALLDLGVSSYQIDSAERGFSYMQDAPLDMRMDKSQYLTAFNVINEYSVSELTKILTVYGEEKFARRIAENIAKTRQAKSIRTTRQLAEIIEASIPAANRFKYGNPCKRTFQAVRIEVNHELEDLDNAISELIRRLKPNGRMCVISFHSLEDRIVKNVFKQFETDCICPKSLPQCVCGKKREVDILTHKPITASEEELKNNTRSECAKLRIIRKI
jgi:16S rRNA (cytosine1402-N4)-methyltransferase